MSSLRGLQLIPKCEKYIEYILNIILRLPRTEKFNLGNEYKTVMYSMLTNILYVNKVEKSKKIHYCNKIDAEINVQRILVRIMYKYRYIDEKKYKYIMDLINEIGKMLGGYLKYLGVNYAQNN